MKCKHENQHGFTYENHIISSEIDVEMQQTCQSLDHNKDENNFKHQEEILEENFYNP